MAEDVFLEQFGRVCVLHYTKNVWCIDAHDVREVYEHTKHTERKNKRHHDAIQAC